jgi:site-specific recombinase XerD
MDGVVAMYDAAGTEEHQALIVLCGMLGLRVSEALSVTSECFDINRGRSSTLTIRGKGDKTRVLPISDKVLEYLDPALDALLERMAKDWDDNRLFTLSDRGARAAIKRIARRAGIGDVSSHDLRMTFGTAAYHNSGDLRAVQELLGHASSATTELYTHVPMEKMAAAAAVV